MSSTLPDPTNRRLRSLSLTLASIGFMSVAPSLVAQEPPPPDTTTQAEADRPLSGIVYGRVVLGNPPAAVPGAIVYVPGTTATAMADSTGAFAMELPPGAWILSVYASDIGDERGVAGPPSALVTIQPGDTIRASFRNTRSAKGDLTNPYVLDALQVVVSRPAVTAPLREGALQRVLTYEEIREAERTARDIGDLLKGRVSGVAVNRTITTGGGQLLCVQNRRGMDNRGDGNPCPGQVAVWVDGVPVNDPTNFLLTLPPDQIERVDFLSALQAGARYGINSGNGVLVITTRNPSRGGSGGR